MLYFVTNQYRQVSIQDWEADMSGNPAFEALTEEQTEFYYEHPGASVKEVRECKITPPYIPPVPSISQLQQEAIERISNLSLNTLDRFVSEYQLANAQVSILWADNPTTMVGNGQEPIYDKQTALGIVALYLRIGKSCRDEFYVIKPRIEAAMTATEIEAIEEEATQFYTNLE